MRGPQLEEHVYHRLTCTQWTSSGLIFQIFFKDSCRMFHLFISELSTTLKHYDLQPQHLFIFIMGLKLGQGMAVASPCSVSWWDSHRTDWRMLCSWCSFVCVPNRLAVTCELIQDGQPGVFFLPRGLSIGLFGLPHGMEAGLQERLFKETGSGSWLVRPCLEFGTVFFVLYSTAKAFKEPVRFPGWDKRPPFFLVCAC